MPGTVVHNSLVPGCRGRGNRVCLPARAVPWGCATAGQSQIRRRGQQPRSRRTILLRRVLADRRLPRGAAG